MRRASDLTIGFALVIAMGCGVSNAAAQRFVLREHNRVVACGRCLRIIE